MAHCEKYTMAAVGHMCNHYERTGNVTRSNDNIDSERTGQNYNLGPARELSQVEFIRERLGEVRCQKRADVNVMVDWVVTIPQDFKAAHPDLERDFFQQTYNFIAERYGGERNIISAYVHRDEVTPHLHCAFIPITADKRRGGEKVCANDVITRKDLRTFHGDLQAHLERSLGVEVNILNEATKEGNKSIQELKRGTAKAELEKLETKRQSLNEKLEHYGERLTALSESYNARKAFLDSPEIKSTVKPEKRFKSGLFGTGEEMVTLRAADFDRLQRQAAEVEKCKDYCKSAEQAYSAWSAKSVKVFDELKAKDKKIEKLEKQVEDGKEQNRKLKADIAELKERDEIAAAVIEQLPAAKALRDEIADRKATEKILAYKPKQEFLFRDDNTIYAEMQRQILTEGKTAATIDLSKVAAVLYANNENTNRTAELIKRFTGNSFNVAYKIAVKGRQLCNGRGFGIDR